MAVVEDRECFFCKSKTTYKYQNTSRWHKVLIKVYPNDFFYVWYCHKCYTKEVYQPMKKAKQEKKPIPSVITNK